MRASRHEPETAEEPSAIPVFRMFALDDAAQQLRRAGQDVIFLTLGKSDLALHPSIVAAIADAVHDPEQSTRVVPGGMPELRQALATHYSTLVGETITPGRVVVDAGTSSLYPSLLRILGATGRDVLIPRPYYPLYRVAAELAGATVPYYDIDLSTMRIDLASVSASITANTAALIANSPGNPLGNIITRSDMRAILSLLPDSTFLVFDEIYENGIFGTEPALASMLLHSSMLSSARTVITNSCSKSYRMYTKRVGWCVIPEWLAARLVAVLQHTRLTVDPCVQLGAIEALRHSEQLDALRVVHEERWKYAQSVLSTLPAVRLLSSAGGFYCTLDCSAFARRWAMTADCALAMDILARAGVATVPGEDFGLPGTLRLSFTSSRFHEAVDRLHAYFTRSTHAVTDRTAST